MESGYTVSPTGTGSYDYHDGLNTSAQQESEDFFGLEHENHYGQHVRRVLHERSVNARYEHMARQGAFSKETHAYPQRLPSSGPLVFSDSAVSLLTGWNATYEKEFRVLWRRAWECPAFHDYRTANPKPDRVAKAEDKKWMPVREECFFRGQLDVLFANDRGLIIYFSFVQVSSCREGKGSLRPQAR